MTTVLRCKAIGCNHNVPIGFDFCAECIDLYRPGEEPDTVPAADLGSLYGSDPVEQEYTGGSVSYYQVEIIHPTSGEDAYIAECNDIIEALGMNYAEGNAFKAIWRKAAARTLGRAKRGYTDGLYDAEKVVFFGKRMVVMAQHEQDQHQE